MGLEINIKRKADRFHTITVDGAFVLGKDQVAAIAKIVNKQLAGWA